MWLRLSVLRVHASQGVANGCWVVDVGWAAACLAAGGHVPEDASEWRVVGDQVGGTCGAEEARRRRLALQEQGQREQQQRRRSVRQEQTAGGDADREGRQRNEGGSAGREGGEVASPPRQEDGGAERAASPGASEGGGGGQSGGDAAAQGLLLQDVQVFLTGAQGCGGMGGQVWEPMMKPHCRPKVHARSPAHGMK